jgi:RNA polymerase sigma factor (sigma-70 family)
VPSDKKSLAYSLTFQAPDRTLTTEDTAKARQKIVSRLKSELGAVLREAVAGLSEGLRAVLVLRDIEGLSTAETAAALDLTETNVKVRLHRGRLALREALTEYFVTSGGGATIPEYGVEARGL